MSNITAKTSSNAFYQARCKASTHNEQLSSREGAADIMSIDRGRLYRIESGVTNPYPEEIHLMADLYNAPELRNYFCKNCCPLGEDVPEVSTSELDRITIKALSSLGVGFCNIMRDRNSRGGICHEERNNTVKSD